MGRREVNLLKNQKCVFLRGVKKVNVERTSLEFGSMCRDVLG